MIDLIKKMSFTDKAKRLLDQRKYTFHVDVRLTKPKIKQLIEEIYKVKVLSINRAVRIRNFVMQHEIQ